MTAFDLFQIATCLVSEGRRGDAAIALTTAMAVIDRSGVDADLRDDLVALRKSLIVVADAPPRIKLHGRIGGFQD
jgi:hypothetical protein